MPVMNREDVKHYERTRYSKPDQWLINLIEQRIVKRFIKYHNLPSGHVLDIPCGFGRFSPIFIEYGMKVTSADISHAMVERTRDKVFSGERACNFLVASVKKLPFKEDSFDLCFTARLLHHNFTREERINILRELGRVSKRFVIVTMYRENFFHKLTRKLRRLQRVIVMLSPDEMEEEVKESGLRILKKEIVLPLVHSQVFLLLEKARP